MRPLSFPLCRQCTAGLAPGDLVPPLFTRNGASSFFFFFADVWRFQGRLESSFSFCGPGGAGAPPSPSQSLSPPFPGFRQPRLRIRCGGAPADAPFHPASLPQAGNEFFSSAAARVLGSSSTG